MYGTVTEGKIQEIAEQIRNIIGGVNTGAPFYSMFHVDGMVVVIDQNGYSISDPKGRRPSVHRIYGEGVRKDA